jgi:dephospho-CoA kinase
MIKVGVTGGIGSGKTTICNVFELLEVPVFNADNVSRLIVNEDSGVIHDIIEVFGANIYRQGKLDRKKLADIVFSNKKMLAQLNEIIHPSVARYFDAFCLKHSKEKYVIKEAAILFETGLNKQLDRIITVTAPVAKRVERVIARDGASEEEVRNRVNNQMSDDKKIALSDFVIDNSDEKLVIKQVLNIHQQLF